MQFLHVEIGAKRVKKFSSAVIVWTQIWIQNFESEYNVYNVLNLCTAGDSVISQKKCLRKLWTRGSGFDDMPSYYLVDLQFLQDIKGRVAAHVKSGLLADPATYTSMDRDSMFNSRHLLAGSLHDYVEA